MMEGLELIHLHVDTLLARFQLLAMPDMDPGVAESIMVVIFAAPRVDIKELIGVRDQLALKHGKDFIKACQVI